MPPEHFAAKELQRAIKLMSGAELAVRPTASDGENAVVIAHRADGGSGEKIRVKREGSKLILQGRTPGQTVHATYEFLRRFCECEACLAMGNVSTRWQKFSIQVMEKLKGGYPDAKYMTLAYQAYRSVPKGCYRHTYNDNCDANPLALKELKEWQKLGAQMGIRG